MHYIHVFKVNAKSAEDALFEVEATLSKFEEECAGKDEEGNDVMDTPYDYYNAFGTITLKNGLFTYSNNGMGDWRHNAPVFGSTEKLAKVFNLPDSFFYEKGGSDTDHDYGEPGITDLTLPDEPKPTHLVLVDFHC